jgi:hypothetical protein
MLALHTVNPKLQLGLSLFLLLVVTPGGVWALAHDIRKGETTHISKWGRWIAYRRAERPRDFWGMIGYTALAGLIGFTLGAWALYDALRRI